MMPILAWYTCTTWYGKGWCDGFDRILLFFDRIDMIHMIAAHRNMQAREVHMYLFA